MSPSARVWLTVGPAAVAAGAAALALVLRSDHHEVPLVFSVYVLVVAWAFVVAGLIARTRRPENPTGALLIVVGFTLFAGALAESNYSFLFTLGLAVGSIVIAALVHLLLAYPSGRLSSRWERGIVVAGYAIALGANAVPLLFDPDPVGDCAECPSNAFLVTANETAHDAAVAVFNGLGFAILLGVAAVLVRRWRRAGGAARRLLGPVLLAGGSALFLFAVSIVIYPLSATAADVASVGFLLAFLALPFLFLWGVLRSRLLRADVSALLEAPETPTLVETQDFVREALRDPKLQLLYWVDDPGGYFDAESRQRVPVHGDGDDDRASTKVDSVDGSPLAVLLHDPALLDERERLASVVAALRLRLEKDRTVRELRISEYRSRALVEAIPDTILRAARDGTLQDIHAHDARHLNLPPEQLIGRSAFEGPPEVISPETLAERKRLVERAFETGEVQSHEYEVNVPSGRRFAETRIVPSGEDEFVMIVRDVTEEKLTESRSEALLEALPDAMFRLTRDGRYLDFHTPHPEVLAISADEIIGTSIYEIPAHRIDPEVIQERMALAERAFETGEVQFQEYEIRRPDGETMFSEARIVPAGDDEWVMIVRDVTDKRVMESRSEALLEALPDAVFRISRDGRYIDFRPPEPAREGIDASSFVGTSIHDALPADVAARVLAAAERAFETGDVQTVEGETIHRGEAAYAEARIVPSGENEFVMIVRDVSERVRQQRQIETQIEFLGAMGDATTGLLCNIAMDGRIWRDGVNLPLRDLTGYRQYELDGRSFWEILPAPQHAAQAEQAVKAVAAGESGGEQEGAWLTRDGEERIVAWTCTRLPQIEGQEQMLMISGTDVTERRRREDEQAALRRVAVAVASEQAPEDVFRIVAEEVGQVLCASGADMVRLDAQRGEAVVVGYWLPGEADARLGEWMTVIEGGPTRTVLESGETTRFEPEGPVSDVVREHLRGAGITSTVVAPVALAGRVWGAISVWVEEGRLPPETEQRIEQFAALVATALANAQAREDLYASRARLVEAGDAERRRLERNLHDGAQQRLVSLSLVLRLAQAKLGSDPQAANEMLNGAGEELALALEELRELARGIHPAVLTDRGLGPALESLADRAPLPVEVDELPASRLPDQVEAAAYYVVSEALANIAKYASASTVSVRIAAENGLAVVEVADDGVGGADPESGSGLRGLTDRVEALQGRLAIVSPPGAGTRIRAEIPCG
jgi:PAS domain S-box-containing protein